MDMPNLIYQREKPMDVIGTVENVK